MRVRLISGISHDFSRLSRSQGQVTHVLLTRSPLLHQVQALSFSVRLACVKHAASVRPEPGSNSPLMKTDTQKRAPTLRRQPTNQPSHPNRATRQAREPLEMIWPTNTSKYSSIQKRNPKKQGTIKYGIDYRHTVEFSKNGRAPPSHTQHATSAGQPLLYRHSSGLVNSRW